MAITLVAYAYVEPGGSAPKCKIQTVSSEIRRYLDRHMDDLLGRAGRGASAPAFFRGEDAEGRFVHLQLGSSKEFVASAGVLTGRLHTAMDNRSKRGFLVAVRRSLDSEEVQAGVLKLDVHDEPAAAARQTGDELQLEAVADLLDLPGDLQKGAVFPDPRAESEVVVGDRVMAETAQYFLRALEVQQIAAPSSATKSLIDVVGSVATGKVDAFVQELDSYDEPVSPQAVFDDHPDLLSDEEREQVLGRLEEQPRPVRIVNPAARPPRVVVSVDGITIRGGVEDMRKVRWVQQGGGWQIQIEVSQEPRKRYE
jgi:hypothetical protein